MFLLFPGRHQLLTNFQFNYLNKIIEEGIEHAIDIKGERIKFKGPVGAIIFAVTSANHSNTRRNPLPFYLRALQIENFANSLSVPAFIYGIDDVGQLKNFASYLIKRIEHDSEGRFDLNSENTAVICSTPVMEMYENIGFQILPAELTNREEQTFQAALPWDLVEHIAKLKEDWHTNNFLIEKLHPSSLKIWKNYGLGAKIQMLFRDKIISEDGDITSTRDYNSYVRQMDEIAELKFSETVNFIKPGRIGDIGCAVGSWIKCACEDEKFKESDFYGIEVARHLFDLCQQRKMNGEFLNPFVFFSQKNAVTGLVFDANSMQTIHTSSLTHEIESYGNHADLLMFIKNRFDELAAGGMWINRDVVGPDNPDEIIFMEAERESGRNDDWEKDFDNREQLATYLSGLSTYARFLRFAKDFRKIEKENFKYEFINIDKLIIKISMRNAMEFIMKKDYVDNWKSEMHEKFCFWSFKDWSDAMVKVGFDIAPSSHSFTNKWIMENRLEGKVKFYNKDFEEVGFPVTHMLMVAEKKLSGFSPTQLGY